MASSNQDSFLTVSSLGGNPVAAKFLHDNAGNPVINPRTNQPTMSRKQRRAMEAKQRKAQKQGRVTVH